MNYKQQSLFRMAAAMCQALPCFYSDCFKKSLVISLLKDFYEKYLVTLDYCVSTHKSSCSLNNCSTYFDKFHILLIGSSFDQILPRPNQTNEKLKTFDNPSIFSQMFTKIQKEIAKTSSNQDAAKTIKTLRKNSSFFNK